MSDDEIRPMKPRGQKPPFTLRPPEDEFKVRTFDTESLLEGKIEPEISEPEPVVEVQPEPDFVRVTVEPTVAPPPAPPRIALKKRRRSRQRSEHRVLPVWISAFFSMVAVSAAAVLMATIFSLWTRPGYFSDEFRAGLSRVQATQHVVSVQPSPLPTDIREVHIGIIAGHSGPPQDPSFAVDPGSVCDDGLTELSVNQRVAQAVVDALRRDQYTVDLLEEFDPRLENYQGDVLLSIHSNDCSDYGPEATGFNVASAASRGTTGGADERLLNCLVYYYGATTGLPRHTGITVDMTDYHNFREVSSDTPTAIIELGFLRNDRATLTEDPPQRLADGISNGIRCFLQPDRYGNPTVPTPEGQ
jgi:N-acetylmuramoyl-L-alanine amidase